MIPAPLLFHFFIVHSLRQIKSDLLPFFEPGPVDTDQKRIDQIIQHQKYDACCQENACRQIWQLDISQKHTLKKEHPCCQGKGKKQNFQDDLPCRMLYFFDVIFHNSIQPEQTGIGKDPRFIWKYKKSQKDRCPIKAQAPFQTAFNHHHCNKQGADCIKCKLDSRRHRRTKKEHQC